MKPIGSEDKTVQTPSTPIEQKKPKFALTPGFESIKNGIVTAMKEEIEKRSSGSDSSGSSKESQQPQTGRTSPIIFPTLEQINKSPEQDRLKQDRSEQSNSEQHSTNNKNQPNSNMRPNITDPQYEEYTIVKDSPDKDLLKIVALEVLEIFLKTVGKDIDEVQIYRKNNTELSLGEQIRRRLQNNNSNKAALINSSISDLSSFFEAYEEKGGEKVGLRKIRRTTSGIITRGEDGEKNLEIFFNGYAFEKFEKKVQDSLKSAHGALSYNLPEGLEVKFLKTGETPKSNQNKIFIKPDGKGYKISYPRRIVRETVIDESKIGKLFKKIPIQIKQDIVLKKSSSEPDVHNRGSSNRVESSNRDELQQLQQAQQQGARSATVTNPLSGRSRRKSHPSQMGANTSATQQPQINSVRNGQNNRYQLQSRAEHSPYDFDEEAINQKLAAESLAQGFSLRHRSGNRISNILSAVTPAGRLAASNQMIGEAGSGGEQRNSGGRLAASAFTGSNPMMSRNRIRDNIPQIPTSLGNPTNTVTRSNQMRGGTTRFGNEQRNSGTQSQPYISPYLFPENPTDTFDVDNPMRVGNGSGNGQGNSRDVLPASAFTGSNQTISRNGSGDERYISSYLFPENPTDTFYVDNPMRDETGSGNESWQFRKVKNVFNENAGSPQNLTHVTAAYVAGVESVWKETENNRNSKAVIASAVIDSGFSNSASRLRGDEYAINIAREVAVSNDQETQTDNEFNKFDAIIASVAASFEPKKKVSEIVAAIEYAKRKGGAAHTYEGNSGVYEKNLADQTVDAETLKFYKTFSARFQKECAACGLITGRTDAPQGFKVVPVGMRLTFLPDELLRNYQEITQQDRNAFLQYGDEQREVLNDLKDAAKLVQTVHGNNNNRSGR